MTNKPKLESIVLSVILISLLLFTVLYFWLQGFAIDKFASFISGISTVGIFILTGFYVIYTNRQLREIQKQRQLNIQPLPNAEINHCIIVSPRLVVDPTQGGEISLIVDFSFNAKIKNIGNGAAVLVDTFSYFEGKDIKYSPEKFYSRRYVTMQENEVETANFSVRDENLEVINSLNKGTDGPCGRNRVFDAMLKYSILYKNILGAGFIYTLNFVLIIGKEDQKKLSSWIAHVNSFNNKFSSDIEEFNAIYKRNRGEAYDYFDGIKNKFYKECKPEPIDCAIRSLPQSFSVKNINSDTFESISDKIYHGVPISGSAYREKEKDEFQKWKQEIIENAFDEQFLEKSPDTESEKINIEQSI